MATIQGIPSDKVADWWPFVRDWCEAALEHGDGLVNSDDILERLLARDLQLWAVFVDGRLTAMCCTEVICWPRGKVLSAPIIGGERMVEWMDDLDNMLCIFGKSLGCTHLQGHGRKGWAKPLKKLGWSDTIIEYQKRL